MSKARRPVADVIHFPVPLTTELESKRKATPVTNEPKKVVTQSMVQSYEDNKAKYLAMRLECIKNGFGEGAIVSRRYKNSNKPALIPANWGIVKSLNTFHSDPTKFRPLNVSWISLGSPDSEHNADDLYIIVPAPDRQSLEMSLMLQDEELNDVPT